MIEVRPLATHREFAGCVDMQRLIWGWEDLDLLPVRFFVVSHDIGGQVLGAFDGARLCGFCLAIPGVKPNGPVYLHSHMLGVLPEYRNAGAGWLLKQAQRTDALERGIHFVEWTFDPLELKNAHFNIGKLGAIVRRYLPDHYGRTTSRLQAGLPTDRCVAEWSLAETRVPSPPAVARISIPADLDRLKQSDSSAAARIQEEVARQFARHFADGLAVTGFERSSNRGTYLLSPWPSE